MMQSTTRGAAYPPPLMTSESGSFAQHTIVGRKPEIIRQVIADNGYPPEIVRALNELKDEIAADPIGPVREDAPDSDWWNRELSVHAGRTWLQVPWYFAETYFYRRLLEAVAYLQPGPWESRDPFGAQKRIQERTAIRDLAPEFAGLREVESTVEFEALLHSCLWGNRADLSNYTVAEQALGGLMAREERANIVIDHTNAVRGLLRTGLERVDFVNDNVGADLFFDLALADFLLVRGWVGRIVFRLKDRPFFVSDAMPRDALLMISLLRSGSDSPARDLGERLHGHLAANRLELTEHAYWTSSLMFLDMTMSLRGELADADLVVLKGDVNYRRLLDDRHWPHERRLEEITGYFPANYLVLRTLKGEIMVGLAPGQADSIAAQDPTWLINGKRGIIQLVSRQVEPTPKAA